MKPYRITQFVPIGQGWRMLSPCTGRRPHEMRKRCPRCGRVVVVAELTVCRCGLTLRPQHQAGELMEVRAMQNQTLLTLQATVAPWWRRWSRRQADARAQLAGLSGLELSELMHQAARLYWHPGRRVDSLVWRVIDAEVQSRKVAPL